MLDCGTINTLQRFVTHSPDTGGHSDSQLGLGILLTICEAGYSVLALALLSDMYAYLFYLVGGCTGLLVGTLISVSVFFFLDVMMSFFTIVWIIFISFWSGFYLELIVGPVQFMTCYCLNRATCTSSINNKHGHKSQPMYDV